MTEIQEKLLELLTEIDDICRSNNIAYYVIGNTALYAYREQHFANENDHQLEIAIRAEDTERFYEAVTAGMADNRYLECLLNNPEFPRYYFNYGNENTLNYCFNYARQWQHQGIYLRVNILHCFDNSMSKGQKKRLSFSKKLWKLTTDPQPGRYSWYVKLVWLGSNLLRRLAGRQRTAQKLFKHWSKVYQSKAGEDAYYYLKKKNYPLEQFGEPYYAQLENVRLPLPHEPEEYFRLTYNKLYENIVLPSCRRVNKGFADIISTRIAYRDYVPQAEQILKETAFWQNYNYKRKQQHKKKKNAETIKYCRLVVLRSKDRIELYRYYQPLKKQILALNPQRENDYLELCELLKPYRNAAWKYYKHKLGFKFDADMEQILIKVLEQEGKENYAAKLKQLSADLQPVCVYDNLLNSTVQTG